MTGGECLLRSLVASGVELCFMNPGTSEMQFVSALDRVPEMRGVLCLFEGVCAGAADGYARMKRRPAATLVHLGPGLGNALSNLHNARKARSPVVSIVGEHATFHLAHNSPLAADTAAFARTVSDWVRVVGSPDEMGAAASEAVAASYGPPGRIACLIVPADRSWSEAGPPGTSAATTARALSGTRVAEAARLLRSGVRAALLLSGDALLARGLDAAGRIASATGARVLADRFAARQEHGGRIFAAERLPYFPEVAERVLAGIEHLILIEAHPPVSFFGYPGRRSELAPEGCEMHVLAAPDEDGPAALKALAYELGARQPARVAERRPIPLPEGEPLTPAAIGRTLANLLPENAILSDEAVSSGAEIWECLEGAPAFDLLPVCGGAIGQGLPVALGAALACPDRKVVALEADGSAMYTPQALWTMAREGADVTVVILANRRYRILEIETLRTGAGAPGPLADAMMDLTRPDLDWVSLARACGVPGRRAATADELIAAFEEAMHEPGPRLIEAQLG